MIGQALGLVFASAAIPQKIVLAVLVGALPMILVAATLAVRNKAHAPGWRSMVSGLRFAGPALGLLVGAMNSFHMGQTILRLPFNPTARQLAPGMLEVATLIGLGALVGLVALAAHLTLDWADAPGCSQPSGQPPGGPV